MKKKLLLSLVSISSMAILLFLFIFSDKKPITEREKFSQFLKEHPFNNHPKASDKKHEIFDSEEEDENETDAPNLAWEQDYLRTLNPAIGRPTPENLPSIMQQMRNMNNVFGKSPGSSSTPWVERGPNNVGGRTCALVWDPNDATGKKVWAGGVSGGLWYNTDITSASSTWTAVDNFWSNIVITCMAFDPNNSLIAYVGTGEGFGTGDSRGAGIWKTTDGGITWNNLSSTSAFYYVNDIVVRNESGFSVVYAAVDGQYYKGVYHGTANAGLKRSTNGGTSWTQTLPNIPSQTINYVAADIEIGANNRLWIGTKANPYSATDRGGGRVLYSDNGTSWVTSSVTTVTNGYGRVEVACAPSNANYVYAVVESDNAVSTIIKTTTGGSGWTSVSLPVDADSGIPSTDFSRGQAWYDLIMAVDPLNESVVVVGGVDLFRSINAGTSWNQISKWSNNNNLASLNCSQVHADQHALVYKPGSSSTLIAGNDGGVFYTTSIATAVTSNVFSSRNNGYNVTQFYACAIHPTANTNNFLAGAQDNGSQKFTSAGMNATSTASGGDGAFCFIDQTNPNYQIVSYTNNNYYLSTNGGTSFSTTILSDASTGSFINPADYDDNMHILYSAKNTSSLYRVRNINSTPTSAETVTINGMSGTVTHLRVSPYTTTSSTLFVGTDAGALYKVTTANGTPTTTAITGSGFPSGAISCVEIGASENELLVTFFNYGVTSVWYTINGGSSWISKEGDLPDMPVRWALFNPGNRNEILLATELGVWASTNFNVLNPNWIPSNSGLANVRVDMLQIRSSDRQVIAATYGRGLFSSNGFTPAIGDFTASTTTSCTGNSVTFTDQSTNNPTVWSWSFTPSTVTFLSGTNANSQNPVVAFQNAGTYSVTLAVSNALGGIPKTKTNYITVTQTVSPSFTLSSNDTNICAGQLATFSISSLINGGSTPFYQWKINSVNTGTNSATYSNSNLNNLDTITCNVTSNANCAQPALVTSRNIMMTVRSKPSVTVILANHSICLGDTLMLNGGTPIGGLFSGTGVSNDTFISSISGVGNFAVKYAYTAANGCSNFNFDTIKVNAFPAVPIVSQLNNTLTCNIASGVSYQWYLNGTAISGATNKTYDILQSGTYKIKVANAGGCSTQSSAIFAVRVALNLLTAMNNFKLYPNPSTAIFKMEFELSKKEYIIFKVLDISSKLVYEQSIQYSSGINTHEINLGTLPKGIYQLQMSDEQSTIQRSLLLE
jgi:PKD repeat protein